MLSGNVDGVCVSRTVLVKAVTSRTAINNRRCAMQPAGSGWCLESLAIAWVVVFLILLLWPDDAAEQEDCGGRFRFCNDTCLPPAKRCGRYPSGYA